MIAKSEGHTLTLAGVAALAPAPAPRFPYWKSAVRYSAFSNLNSEQMSKEQRIKSGGGTEATEPPTRYKVKRGREPPPPCHDRGTEPAEYTEGSTVPVPSPFPFPLPLPRRAPRARPRPRRLDCNLLRLPLPRRAPHEYARAPARARRRAVCGVPQCPPTLTPAAARVPAARPSRTPPVPARNSQIPI